MIRLTHKKTGGRKIAYLEAEAVADEKNGWVRDIPNLQKTVTEIPAVEMAVSNTLSEQYEKKFGKKPHHRLSNKSIEAALKE